MTTKRELERRVKDAAMRLYNSRAGLKYQSHGLDCEGVYWYVRDNSVTKAYRTACAALAAHERKRRGK